MYIYIYIHRYIYSHTHTHTTHTHTHTQIVYHNMYIMGPSVKKLSQNRNSDLPPGYLKEINLSLKKKLNDFKIKIFW